MEFFQDTHFDFMRYRKIFGGISIALVILGLLAVFVHGKLNIGIDFAGGTQIIVRFRERPEPEKIRKILEDAGIDAAQIQTFGAEDANEVMIRTPLVKGGEEGDEVQVLQVLDTAYNENPGSFDLNQRGSDALADKLFQLDPDDLASKDQDLARTHYREVADAIIAARQDKGIFAGWDRISSLPEVTPELLSSLKDNVTIGHLGLLGTEVVGPQIGSELRRKGIGAVVASLIGMLIYIWIRFELRFGVGALVALMHDVVVALGFYAYLNYEFNLSTIAAFLTLVGYSVNDTVVVFDRVRENLRRNPRTPLVETLNASLNQTLSRTVLTSGTTLLAVGALFFLGGDVLRGFSFVLLIGIIVGTYSSIFVASPITLLWERLAGSERRARSSARKSSSAGGKGGGEAVAGGRRR